MKYLKLFENHNIESICREYGITNYTPNSDGTIDVDDDIYLNERGLTKLPLKFRNITGYFDCGNNALTSLEGSPRSVGGGFYCNNNKITSLEFSPKSVVGDFYCSYNKITSLEFAPKSVGGNFYCLGNPLYNVWKLISPDDKWDSSIIELFNDYDCIREGDIIMVRFNDFLIEIGKDPVNKVEGYKII